MKWLKLIALLFAARPSLLVKERGFGEEKARFFFRQLVEGVNCCVSAGPL